MPAGRAGGREARSNRPALLGLREPPRAAPRRGEGYHRSGRGPRPSTPAARGETRTEEEEGSTGALGALPAHRGAGRYARHVRRPAQCAMARPLRVPRAAP